MNQLLPELTQRHNDGSVRSSISGGNDQPRDAMQRHLAWQRAMEQAQCVNWFQTPGQNEQAAQDPSSESHATQTVTARHVPAQRAVLRMTSEAYGNEAATGLAKQNFGPADPHTRDRAGAERTPATPSKTSLHGNDADLILADALGTWLNAMVVTVDSDGLVSSVTPPNIAVESCLALSPNQSYVATPAGMPVPSSSASVASAIEKTAGPVAEGRAAVATVPDGRRDPVRMHAEWNDQGLMLWIGADAGQGMAVEQMSLLLVRQLRQWLTQQGSRLTTLICNGKTVWSDGDFTQTSYSDRPDAMLRRPNQSEAGSGPAAAPIFFNHQVLYFKDAP